MKTISAAGSSVSVSVAGGGFAGFVVRRHRCLEVEIGRRRAGDQSSAATELSTLRSGAAIWPGDSDPVATWYSRVETDGSCVDR